MSSRAKERKAGQEGGGKLKKATNQPDLFSLAKKGHEKYSPLHSAAIKSS